MKYYTLLLLLFVNQCYPTPMDRGLYLRVMDNNIVKKLLCPTAEGGSRLMKDLKVYNEYFGKLMRLLLTNKEKVLKTAAAMADQKEEDRFFNKQIDYDKLKTDFGWTDKELQEVHNLISESQHLWDNFKKKYLHIGLSK